jgi:hypothetical protein
MNFRDKIFKTHKKRGFQATLNEDFFLEFWLLTIGYFRITIPLLHCPTCLQMEIIGYFALSPSTLPPTPTCQKKQFKN